MFAAKMGKLSSITPCNSVYRTLTTKQQPEVMQHGLIIYTIHVTLWHVRYK